MAPVPIISTIIDGFSQLLAPKVCHICGRSLVTNEQVLCLHCLTELPRTNIHRCDFNEIHRRLGHHVKVDRAAGWFNYTKGSPYAKLLVDSKYNGLPRIDYHLGTLCASDLSRDHFFDGIDILVPMPMYWRKKLMRGYNQAYEICMGIRSVTDIPVTQALIAVRPHGVQSRHSRQQRHTSIADTMEVRDTTEIAGRSILLVDDIITSGASCIEALRALSEAAPTSINVLSLGLTSTV